MHCGLFQRLESSRHLVLIAKHKNYLMFLLHILGWSVLQLPTHCSFRVGRSCALWAPSLPQTSKKITFSASLAVHGTWDEWSPWSLCSSTCGRGYRDRTRTCKPPQFGGNPCEGPEKQTKFCNIALCPGRDSDRSETSPPAGPPAQCPSCGSSRSVADSSEILNDPREDPEGRIR